MIKVCLDPGHGAGDPGALLGKRYEKDDVLRLALAVKPLLEAQGVGVVMTRTDDKTVLPIAERCQMANSATARRTGIRRTSALPTYKSCAGSHWASSQARSPAN